MSLSTWDSNGFKQKSQDLLSQLGQTLSYYHTKLISISVKMTELSTFLCFLMVVTNTLNLVYFKKQSLT